MLLIAGMLWGASSAAAEGVSTAIAYGSYAINYSVPTMNQSNVVPGGYLSLVGEMNPYFGLETRLGLTNEGTTTYPNGSSMALRMSGFSSLLARISLPVDEDFKVFGVVGMTNGQFTRTNTTNAVQVIDTAQGNSVSYGVGLNYRLGEIVQVGAEWTSYWSNVALGAGIKSSISGACVVLRFGD